MSIWTRRAVALAAGCAALASVGCKSRPRVQVLGESTRLEKSRPSPNESPWFDGSRLSLLAARGETLGLSVRISDGTPRRAWLSVDPRAARVTGFGVGNVRVREPSTSMYGPSDGPGDYPDVLQPLAAPIETSGSAYFDVSVRSSAAPGTYSGSLELGERRIPVVLEVARARIDLEKDPLVWAFYLPREIARAHGLPDGDGPELIAREQAYYALFREHGVLLASDLSPARLRARWRFVRDVHYWPVAIDTTSDAGIARDVRSVIELFRGSGVTPFAILMDEPQSSEQRRRVRHIAEMVKAAGGGRPALLGAVTDTVQPEYGDALDVFISPSSFPRVAGGRASRGERFWTYNGRPPSAGSMIVDTAGSALRSWGWIAYRYDIELWYAWEALYFSDRYNGGGPADFSRNAISFDQRGHGGSDFGNGDGVLAYPGPLPSLRLKALRRGLSDRLLLRELEGCGQRGLARQIARRLIPRALGEASGAASWPGSEAEWERARREVLRAIERYCRD